MGGWGPVTEELFLKDRIFNWKLSVQELKHLLKSFLITFRNFSKKVGFHGNINQHSITLSRLPVAETDPPENADSPFAFGYRLNYIHWDVKTPFRWAVHKLERLKSKQRCARALTSRVLIEPFAGMKIQKYYEENQNKIDDSSAQLGLFTDEDIRQHDLFSIAFIILHTQIKDLPLVYQFFDEANGVLLKFDFESFLAKVDAYFETLVYEDKFVRIIKKMIDYDGLQKSTRRVIARRGLRKAPQRPKSPDDDFRAVDSNGEQNPEQHEQPNRVRDRLHQHAP